MCERLSPGQVVVILFVRLGLRLADGNHAVGIRHAAQCYSACRPVDICPVDHWQHRNMSVAHMFQRPMQN